MDNISNDKETENTVTMCDVLQEEQELEEDANAVLGGSDDTNCSYDKGYISRQALYACKTCNVNGEAGVCLACCYACHDGHEVVELYTKRNFRCDCGNSNFDKQCTLRPNKDPINLKNKYNHNFKGLYCSCRRPYPDLEDTTPDEMIQCVLCEDWYHGRHLGTKVPDDYYEMICQSCMESHEFLYAYMNGYHVNVDDEDCLKKPPGESLENGHSVPSHDLKISSEVKKDTLSNSSTELCVLSKEEQTGVPGNAEKKVRENFYQKNELSGGIESCNSKTVIENPKTEQVLDSIKIEATEGMSLAGGSADVKPNLNDNCVLKKMHLKNRVKNGAAFWSENWRKELCHCSSCLDLYRHMSCEFLLNLEDTVHAYEERGQKSSGESQYDKGLSALSKLDRVKQMEAVRAYTNMKGQLVEYLKEFADKKRTVCESDIKEFFDRMNKKQKLNGVPHFCR